MSDRFFHYYAYVYFFLLSASRIASYELIFRKDDNVTNPQINCHRLYNKKIAYETHIKKHTDALSACIPKGITFWVGPFSRTGASSTGKCHLFTCLYPCKPTDIIGVELIFGVKQFSPKILTIVTYDSLRTFVKLQSLDAFEI